MVLCAADTTLEPSVRITSADGVTTSASWAEGNTHMCRNWNQVMDFAKANFETWKDEAGHATEPGLPDM